MVNERDANVLKKIIEQCVIMETALTKYKLSPDALIDDGFLFNACCETVFQIGELINCLSEEFQNTHNGQSWNKIYGMRNIIGHHYGKINILMLWKTVKDRLPELKLYCESILNSDN